MNNLLNLTRKLVSRDRVRFKEGKLDLDLTYITDKVIAMSFPGSGVEAAWRNNIKDTHEMLSAHHEGHFMIYNLTDRKYDYELFNNQIMDVGFPDHLAPPLPHLFKIIQFMYSWLSADEKNVAVVHCLAGKGRTGTVITAYLLYCPEFEPHDVSGALKIFAQQRSKKEKGVTQPSQLRYVLYFSKILCGYPISQKKLRLRRIIMDPVPSVSKDNDGGCSPVIDIYNVSEVNEKEHIYTSKNTTKFFKKSYQGGMIFDVNVALVGDFMIKCHHHSRLGIKTKLFHVCLNTIFFNEGYYIIDKDELDGACKDPKFDKFYLTLLFDEDTKTPFTNAERKYFDELLVLVTKLKSNRGIQKN